MPRGGQGGASAPPQGSKLATYMNRGGPTPQQVRMMVMLVTVTVTVIYLL